MSRQVSFGRSGGIRKSPRQSYLSKDGSNPTLSAHASFPLPQSKEDWQALDTDVGSGTESFKSKSNDAILVTNMLMSNAIPLSVTPSQVRAAIPALHKYKESSFRTWYYKVRSALRVDPPPTDGDEEYPNLRPVPIDGTSLVVTSSCILLPMVSSFFLLNQQRLPSVRLRRPRPSANAGLLRLRQPTVKPLISLMMLL